MTEPQCTCDLDWDIDCPRHGTDSKWYEEFQKQVEKLEEGKELRIMIEQTEHIPNFHSQTLFRLASQFASLKKVFAGLKKQDDPIIAYQNLCEALTDLCEQMASEAEIQAKRQKRGFARLQ